MHKHLMAALLPALILLSCNSNTSSGAVVAAPSGDSAFSRISEEFLAREIAWSPESAVALGFHQYDGKLTDYSRASLDSELTRLKAYDQRLSALDSATLSPKAFYDYRILRAGILNSIFNFEDKRTYTQNPMTYAGAIDPSIYVKRNFGPRKDRLRSIISIENGAPAVFAAAKANLTDSLPKPYIETAILVAEGSASFLGKDLVTALKEVKNDSLMTTFKAANKLAISQIHERLLKDKSQWDKTL